MTTLKVQELNAKNSAELVELNDKEITNLVGGLTWGDAWNIIKEGAKIIAPLILK